MSGAWLEAEQERITAYRVIARMRAAIGQVPSLTGLRIPSVIDTLGRAEPVWIEETSGPLFRAAIDSFDPEPFGVAEVIPATAFVLMPESFMGDRVMPSGQVSSVRLAFLWRPFNDGFEAWQISLDRGMAVVTERTTYQEGVTPADWAVQLQAVIRLMGERVVTVQREAVTGPARKWGPRAGTKAAATVRVIVLRRPAGSSSGESHDGAHWTRRWVVRGHWRQQWWPKVHEHRQRWIDPYVKGPASMPLVVARDVFEFRR